MKGEKFKFVIIQHWGMKIINDFRTMNLLLSNKHNYAWRVLYLEYLYIATM